MRVEACWNCGRIRNIPTTLGLCWACYARVRRHKLDGGVMAARALDSYWPEWEIWRRERREELARLAVAAEVVSNELDRYFMAHDEHTHDLCCGLSNARILA